MITDRDIAVRGFATGKNPLDTPVSSIMSGQPFTVDENNEIEAALELMENHVELLRAVSRRPLVVAS